MELPLSLNPMPNSSSKARASSLCLAFGALGAYSDPQKSRVTSSFLRTGLYRCWLLYVLASSSAGSSSWWMGISERIYSVACCSRGRLYAKSHGASASWIH